MTFLDPNLFEPLYQFSRQFSFSQSMEPEPHGNVGNVGRFGRVGLSRSCWLCSAQLLNNHWIAAPNNHALKFSDFPKKGSVLQKTSCCNYYSLGFTWVYFQDFSQSRNMPSHAKTTALMGLQGPPPAPPTSKSQTDPPLPLLISMRSNDERYQVRWCSMCQQYRWEILVRFIDVPQRLNADTSHGNVQSTHGKDVCLQNSIVVWCRSLVQGTWMFIYI